MIEGTKQRIFAVLLAAGSSQRFGSTEQLQVIDGIPMVRKAAMLARAVCGNRSLLVAGFDHPVVRLEHGTLGFVAGQRRRAG